VGELMEFDKTDIAVMLEILVTSEKIKPTQYVKREVLKKYGLLATAKDRVITAIIYEIGRRLGLIDRIYTQVLNLDKDELNPWVRASLRLITFVCQFRRNDVELIGATRIYTPLVIKDVLGQEEAWRIRDYFTKVCSFSYKPKTDDERLEVKFMVSAWIIRKLESEIGKEETIEFLKAINERPPLSLRVNTLKASVEEILQELRKLDIDAWISPYVPTVIKFRGRINYEEFRPFTEGKVIPQEDSSAMASIILGPKPGEVVVDLCAAPGGKTTHIAELMKNQGKIYAFEIYEDRAEYLRNLLKRVGVTIAEVIVEDARKAPELLGRGVADRVLLDPPCSSTGTLAKNFEARWRIDDEKLSELTALQKELLRSAVLVAKVGGRILYTTCSVFVEEGEEVVRSVLEEFGDALRLVHLKGPFSEGFLPGTMRAWPHKHKTTGFFYALLEKVKEVGA